MPRDKVTREFVAGVLHTITFQCKKYFVDGRLKECRSVDEHWVKLDPCDEDVYNLLSEEVSNMLLTCFWLIVGMWVKWWNLAAFPKRCSNLQNNILKR